MALHITPSDTSSIEVATGDAFADNGTVVPDFTLIVDANAFLISQRRQRREAPPARGP